MSTSQSTSFNPVRDTVIKRALRMVNAYASTDEPRPEQMADALESLNMLLKAWQVEGFLWLKQIATLFLAPGQAKYLLPGSETAVEYVETTVVSDGGSYPAKTLSVTSTAGMVAGYRVGVALDANTIHWDAIGSVDSSTGVTLVTGLPTVSSALRPVFAFAASAQTTIAADATTFLQKNIQVLSTKGMNIGDTIVFFKSASKYSDVIASVDSDIDITITTGFLHPGYIGDAVYSYTSVVKRPTRITTPTRRVYGGSDLPLGDTGKTISREEYMSLPNKTSAGTPLMAFYDPQLVNGALYLWPVPNDCRDRIIFTCDRPIQDMISDTDTFDVPQEQLIRITYALALELAPEYALPSGQFDRLALRYKGIAEALIDFDRETADTQIMPSR